VQPTIRRLIYLASITFVLSTASHTSYAQIPNPILYMTDVQYVTVGGQDVVRYRYDVANKDAYPANLFAAAPSLPPCGANTNASRTWVDLFDQSGKRLNGFCALNSPQQLSSIWFALPVNVVPPSWIFIVLTDRQTNAKYKSNLAETTQ
jgi:hypothetical protein